MQLTSLSNDTVEIEVSDTGIGMTKEIVNNLFKEYSTFDQIGNNKLGNYYYQYSKIP